MTSESPATDKTPWWIGGLLGTAWYAGVVTVGGPATGDIALIGLAAMACLPVWIFAEVPDARQRPSGPVFLPLCLVSVLAAGAVAALAAHEALDPDTQGRAFIVLIVFLTTAGTIVLMWLVWAVMTGLALVSMGASLEPGWLVRVSGRWVPWVPIGLGLLTAYQLWGVPNAVPGDIAVDLPTNIVFGGLYATAMLVLSHEALRARQRLSLDHLTPLSSVLVGAVPLGLLASIRMIALRLF